MRTAWILGGMLASVAVHAAPLTVTVKGADGKPIVDAVVQVHLVGRPTPLPQGGGRFQVVQRDIQFHPFVLVVPLDSDVSFPNQDPVRHHVYSFSEAKRFELKLYAREQNRSVRFDRAGVVPLGCNIHDQMSAYLDVVDTPWAVKTDANGVARLDVPAGAVSLSIWHPYLRAPNNMLVRQGVVGGDGAHEAFTVALRSPPKMTGSTGY